MKRVPLEIYKNNERIIHPNNGLGPLPGHADVAVRILLGGGIEYLSYKPGPKNDPPEKCRDCGHGFEPRIVPTPDGGHWAALCWPCREKFMEENDPSREKSKAHEKVPF